MSKNTNQTSKNAKKPTKKEIKAAKKRKVFLIKLVVALSVWALLALSVVFFEPQINHALGFVDSEGNVMVSDMPLDDVLAKRSTSALTIHYVDVGQGDAIVIELPSTTPKPTLMLVDGGSGKNATQLTSYIDATFPELRGADSYFEYVVLTHTDEDHCGGLDDAISAYGAKYIYRPNIKSTYSGYVDPAVTLSGRNKLSSKAIGGQAVKNTLAYMRFLDASYKSNVANSEVIVSVNPLTATDEMQKYINVYDGNGDGNYNSSVDCVIKFWAPLAEVYSNSNDYSVIFTIDYLGRRALFTGDAEKQAEADFVAQYSTSFGAKVDIFKLGHHGSHTSSNPDFINLILPTNRSEVYVVIQCGIGNSYNHPREEVLERLKNAGIKDENVLRNDLNSNIVFNIRSEAGKTDGVISFGIGLQREIKSDPMRWLYLAITIGLLTTSLLFADYKKIIKQLNKQIKK